VQPAFLSPAARRGKRRDFRGGSLTRALGDLASRLFLFTPLRFLFGPFARVFGSLTTRLLFLYPEAGVFFSAAAGLFNSALLFLTAAIGFGKRRTAA
jgi:hypothetical protein